MDNDCYLGGNYLKKANTFIGNGQLEEAANTLRSAIKENPNFYLYHHNLGETLAKLGDLDGAIAAYRGAIALKPDYVWSVYSLGKLLINQGKLEEAMLTLQKAVAIYPSSAFYGSLGIVLMKLKRVDEATDCFQKALDIHPLWVGAYLHLGRLKSEKKLWSEAVVLYRQAVEFCANGDAYFGMARALVEMGQLEEAVTNYRLGTGLSSDVAEVYSDLGMTLEKLGRWEEAATEYQKARKISPNSIEVHLKLGEVLQKLGRVSEAESCYRCCLEIEPQQFEARTKLEALSSLQAQVSTKSEEQKKKQVSLALGVEEGEKIFQQAQAYFRQREYDKAVEKCSYLLSCYPLLKNVFPLLAEAHIKKGKSLQGNNFLQVVQDIRRLIAIPTVEDVWGKALEEWPNLRDGNSKVNKIVIYTCVWKRPELTRIVLSYYSMLKRELAGKIQLELLAVGSEGKQSRQLCESCGFDYVEYQNQPLSDKWEYGINRCRDYNPDAVIIVGSDDLISQSLIEFYDRKLKEGLVFCGITDAYFLDLQTEKMIHWVGYTSQVDAVRLGETTGMGRCLSKPLLERLDFSIWRNLNKDRNLDGAMTQKLYQVGLELLDEEHSVITQVGDRALKVGHCGFKLADINAMAVDIKFAENLTNFHRYARWNSNSVVPQLNSWNLIEKNFPHPIIDQLKELILTTRKILHIEESQEFSLPPSSNILELSEGDQSFLEQVISVNSLQANETFSDIIFHSLKNFKSLNNQDFQQGIDLLKRSKYEDALKLFEKLVEQDSHYIFYYYLGECLSELGKWKEAVDAYKEANNLNPKFVNSYAKCGDVFMKLGQWDNAKNQFYQAVCALL